VTALRVDAARGQPLVAMVVVLIVWVSLRLVFWQSPLMLREVRSEWAFPGAIATLPERLGDTARVAGEMSALGLARLEADFQPLVRIELGGLEKGRVQDWSAGGEAHLSAPSLTPGHLRGRPSLQLSESPRGDSRRRAVASAATMADPVFTPVQAVPSRWTMSSWLFWRDDSLGGRQAATTPNYGRSQAGVVLAYRLAPESKHRPQAYARAITALEGPGEADLAAGLSARPLPDVPLRLAAEARLALRDGASELRPAAFVVTELPPFALPGQFVGEVYAQAGWVGGDFATGFVDGQVRLNRVLEQNQGFTLSAGGGAWVGAQKGTRRFDIGPTAAVSFRLGDDVYGRLSADYRVRVAGNAAPASGPALTLSAGF
tara:strand:+ start:38482 stop:39603 length:1122 start_codon:yes stop_codon:yes gene_type:complete